MTYAFEAQSLVKRFGRTTALAGVDMAAAPGTVLGLLGPNGAGKTTIVRILATLLRPDAGYVAVGGLDVVRQARQVRRLIGLTGQYAAVDDGLTGAENLVLIGQLLDLRRAAAKAGGPAPPAPSGPAEPGRPRAAGAPRGLRRRPHPAPSPGWAPPVTFPA